MTVPTAAAVLAGRTMGPSREEATMIETNAATAGYRIEDPIAALRGVVKRYGKVTALAGVDLELERGRLTAVLGPNGAGKTTVVKLLLGLARPSAGSVTLFG